MTTRPTSAQLKKLEVKTAKIEEVPQAPPEVAAKARELLNGKGGTTVEGVVLTSSEDIIAFLAHILKGVPFLKRYELFGGKVSVEFTTLPLDVIEAIYKFACVEEASNPAAKPDNRRSRVHSYRAATSIKKLRIDGHLISGISDINWETDRFYNLFVKTVTPDLLSAIEETYAKYSGLVAFLISKADDKSFYEAP